MKRARIGTLAWLAVVTTAPAASGQGLPDEVTGVLEVTEHEAAIEAEGRIRLIHVSPVTRVDLDPLFDEMADQVRFLDGQRVTAILSQRMAEAVDATGKKYREQA